MSKAKTKEKEVRQLIISEMAEDAWSEVNREITKIIYKATEFMPTQVFQEKHTNGLWWRKRTYYTYWRYFEGHMIQVSSYSSVTIASLEK